MTARFDDSRIVFIVVTVPQPEPLITTSRTYGIIGDSRRPSLMLTVGYDSIIVTIVTMVSGCTVEMCW
jgi:hypothetical protein